VSDREPASAGRSLRDESNVAVAEMFAEAYAAERLSSSMVALLLQGDVSRTGGRRPRYSGFGAKAIVRALRVEQQRRGWSARSLSRYNQRHTVWTMKTAISLPDPLYEAADALAGRLGITRSELFRRALERLLSDYDDEQVTEALNRVYASESSALDPTLARIQAASLGRQEW